MNDVSMVRILQVIPYFYPAWSFGGPVRVAFHISRELVARGHEVTVFTTTALDASTDFKASRNEYMVDGIKVRYFANVARFKELYFSPSMASALRKEAQNSDIVHLHEYRSFQNVATYYISKRCRRPYVLTAHGSVPRVFERFVLKELFDEMIGYRILKCAARLLASSEIEMKQYMEAGISKDRIAIIPNGIDIELFEHLPEEGAFKKKFGLDCGPIAVLYVGRIHRRKGIDFLLDAFAQLNYEKAMLVIAGPGDRYMAALREKAVRLGIGRKVLFTGFISDEDKLAAYVDSGLVVYPGIYESFPLVPLEAALCKKPVIVADDSVMSEIVHQGGFGLSTKYGDVTQLRNRLGTILNNPRMAADMGRRGRDFVMKNYSWHKIVSRLELVYQDILARD